MIKYFIQNDDDYLYNTGFNNNYPDGCDVEIFAMNTLKSLQHIIDKTESYVREHLAICFNFAKLI